MAIVRFEQKNNSKRAATIALFAASVVIIALGLAFGVYSWIYHVNYTVMSMDIPGFIFAAVVVFLGVRYFRSVMKMNKTLSSTTQNFSWKNFKINRKNGGLKK